MALASISKNDLDNQTHVTRTVSQMTWDIRLQSLGQARVKFRLSIFNKDYLHAGESPPVRFKCSAFGECRDAEETCKYVCFI